MAESKPLVMHITRKAWFISLRPGKPKEILLRPQVMWALAYLSLMRVMVSNTSLPKLMLTLMGLIKGSKKMSSSLTPAPVNFVANCGQW